MTDERMSYTDLRRTIHDDREERDRQSRRWLYGWFGSPGNWWFCVGPRERRWFSLHMEWGERNPVMVTLFDWVTICLGRRPRIIRDDW